MLLRPHRKQATIAGLNIQRYLGNVLTAQIRKEHVG